MAVNDLNILAGEGGTSLAYIGDPTTALDGALAGLTYNGALTGTALGTLKDAGWVSDAGLVSGRDYATTGLAAYGSRGVPVRTFVTTDTRTFTITFLETNPTTVAVYEGKALADVTATAGVIAVETGEATGMASYSLVFDVHDEGRGHGRIIVPRADITAVAERTIAGGAAIARGVTFTAKPVTITTGTGETATTRVIATRELWFLGNA